MNVEILYHHVESYDSLFKLFSSKVENFLTREEIIRYERYRFKRDKVNFLLGRVLVRKYLDISKYDFETNKYGKLISNKDVGFNISHTENFVAVSFSSNFNIGVDVEKIRDMNEDELADLLSYCASVNEKSNLYNKKPDNRAKEFFKIWTGKEAYLKALGIGLVNDLPDICIHNIKNDKKVCWHDEIIENKFYLSSVAISSDINEKCIFNAKKIHHSEIIEYYLM